MDRVLRIACRRKKSRPGWMGGWVDGKAVLGIAYSNQKCLCGRLSLPSPAHFAPYKGFNENYAGKLSLGN